MSFSQRQTGRLRPWGIGVAVLLLLGLFSVQTALAHVRVDVGPYAIVFGWLTEPPIVGERNAVIVEISQDGEPVTGAEVNLSIELLYGSESFRANLNPTTTPGFYTVDVFPTIRGQYQVRLFGELPETAVDVTAEPEPVFAGDRIQFPEPLPDSWELQKTIHTLENNLQSARTISMVAVVTAVLALLLAIFGLVRKR